MSASTPCIMWEVGRFMPDDAPIRPRKVIKETEHFVFVADHGRKPRREHKNGTSRFFADWRDAQQHLIARCDLRVERARDDLVRAESALRKAQNLLPPGVIE